MAKATVRPCRTPPLGTSVSMWNDAFRIEKTSIILRYMQVERYVPDRMVTVFLQPLRQLR